MLRIAVAVLTVAACAASAQLQPAADVLLKVNGAAVSRDQVLKRLWTQYGDSVVGQLVDEILVEQAAREAKLKPDAAQVEARLKRIASQFPDEATFKQKLAASGGSLDAVRKQLNEQVLREQLVISARKLAVTDAEVKEFFEANKEKLGTSAASHVRHLLVATEKEAADFLVALRAGADFAKLAAQVSLDKASKENAGDLGWVSPGSLQPQFEQVVFALKPGQITDPIRTAQGFELLKVEETRALKPAVFKDIQKDLKQALLAEKISKAWPGYLEDLRKQAKIEQQPK